MGLGQVRELTRATTRSIVEQQPFVSFDDFLIRARPLYVEAANLVKAGACEGLGPAPALLEKVEQTRWHGRHPAQWSLMPADVSAIGREVSVAERAGWEREVLDTLVSVHPLQLVAYPQDQRTCVPSTDLAGRIDRTVMVAGVRLAAHRFKAPSQEAMLLVDMEDLAGSYQVLWSSAALRDDGALLNQWEPVLIHGRVRRDRRGQIVVVGSALESLAH
jgi:DNA polymerase III alpha subunit